MTIRYGSVDLSEAALGKIPLRLEKLELRGLDVEKIKKDIRLERLSPGGILSPEETPIPKGSRKIGAKAVR